MFRFVAVFVLLVFSGLLHAQKEASIWYFGLRAGLDFRSGSPTVLFDGQMSAMEGVASISDSNGNLLFYTEGGSVWNRLHLKMPNGTGLKGHFSSSQSAIVVPKINDPGRYYLFTTPSYGGPEGFNYSIINMALDGGKGDVEVKNVLLEPFVCEKLTAVKHCNGQDIWVLVHRFNSADILAYLVTEAGVNPVPVVSSAGIFVPSTALNYSVGCMKASPDGSKLAVAHFDFGAEVMDFNNRTGVVSGGGPLFPGPVSYGNPRGAYGVEFSPNSKYLYVAGDYPEGPGTTFANYVLQYDVTLPDIASIRSSKYIVAWKPRVGREYTNMGTLQVAPDGKIYLAEIGPKQLSVIHNPNQFGATCNFTYRSLELQRSCTYGLPSFIQSNFRGDWTYRGKCSGEPVFFDYDKSNNELSVKWDFGDGTSGINNTSTQDSCQHIFDTSGIYTVKLIRFTACGSDTLAKTLNIGMSHVSLGADSLVCGANQFVITPQVIDSTNNFLWQDSSTTPTITATKSGLYWVEVTNNVNGCKKRDSVNLALRPYPAFSLGNDLDKCEGDIVNLSVDVSPANYLWSNGSTSNFIQVTQSDNYWLEVTSNGCKKRDTVIINFHPYPVVNLGRDTTLCEGNPLVLDAQNPGMRYLWENNASSQLHPISNSGLYWVSVSKYGCTRSDSVLVNFLERPGFVLKDTSICPGMTLTLKPAIKKGMNLTFLWNTGSTDTIINVSLAGNYALTVSNQCADLTRDINVRQGKCQLFIPSAFTPNGDGLNDVFKALQGENVIEFNLRVYDRWGEVVFSSKDKNKGWDGRYKGQQLSTGMYVWIIKYKTITDPHERMQKGTVMLIR